MHRMTRNIEGAKVAAPFQGESLSLGDDRATLETRGRDRFVQVEGKGRPPQLYRVTREIGGRHREDFVGVLQGEGETGAASEDELVLPVSYLIDTKRLRYKGYSVMVRERPRLAAGPVWNKTCPFCHNTVPLLATLYGALASSKAPNMPAYQGEVVDRLLPDDRAFRYRVTDEQAFGESLDREVLRLGGTAPTGALPLRLRQTIKTTRKRFTGTKLLEVGIGCEACHGGAREHAETPAIHPSLLPTAPYLAVESAAGAPSAADIENPSCARCHQVLFSRYPWTWEGGRRHAMPGGSHISSGEARDLLLGGCKGALHCTSCHDPHAADESARLAELETPKGNAVCLSCHAALAAPDALRKHAHHDPLGTGGACVACHMPKKNLSLDTRLSRYHRIGSPTDADRVLGDRPLECALCHVDRSVRQLTESMEAWWGKHYDREALVRSYGDLDANVLRATLQRGKPHEKATAMFLLGEAHDRVAAPLFAAELRDEYPLVRGYAATALRSTFGEACDLDLSVDRASLEAALARCAAVSGLTFPAARGTFAGPVDDSPIED